MSFSETFWTIARADIDYQIGQRFFLFAYPAPVVDTFTCAASALSAASVSPLRVAFHPMTACAE